MYNFGWINMHFESSFCSEYCVFFVDLCSKLNPKLSSQHLWTLLHCASLLPNYTVVTRTAHSYSRLDCAATFTNDY